MFFGKAKEWMEKVAVLYFHLNRFLRTSQNRKIYSNWQLIHNLVQNQLLLLFRKKWVQIKIRRGFWFILMIFILAVKKYSNFLDLQVNIKRSSATRVRKLSYYQNIHSLQTVITLIQNNLNLVFQDISHRLIFLLAKIT